MIPAPLSYREGLALEGLVIFHGGVRVFERRNGIQWLQWSHTTKSELLNLDVTCGEHGADKYGEPSPESVVGISVNSCCGHSRQQQPHKNRVSKIISCNTKKHICYAHNEESPAAARS